MKKQIDEHVKIKEEINEKRNKLLTFYKTGLVHYKIYYFFKSLNQFLLQCTNIFSNFTC